jgi:hypothetical protein
MAKVFCFVTFVVSGVTIARQLNILLLLIIIIIIIIQEPKPVGRVRRTSRDYTKQTR